MYPSVERPGYGAFVWHQADQLQQAGHDVDVVNILGFQSKLNYVRGAIEVARRTRQSPYDIVHAHYGLSAFPAWFRRRAPLVITLHGGDVLSTRLQSCLSRFIWRFADGVVVVSEELRRKIPGVVIPCGVDLAVFRPYDRQASRARLGWPPHKALILFPYDPARPVKRYDLARAAVDELGRQGLDVELMSVSGVKNSEMPWYYSAADVMLLCSDWEGSPTSVKEALACNLPVVATDVGDLREIMRGVSGSRICAQNVGDIARNLGEVLAATLRDRCHSRSAMARYDQAATIQRLLLVYRQILGSRAGRRVA